MVGVLAGQDTAQKRDIQVDGVDNMAYRPNLLTLIFRDTEKCVMGSGHCAYRAVPIDAVHPPSAFRGPNHSYRLDRDGISEPFAFPIYTKTPSV